jgi:cell fate regulator YaaT (PSP1 superfamily)
LFDGNRLLFLFAEGRIDFRVFVRELAYVFKTHRTASDHRARRGQTAGRLGCAAINTAVQLSEAFNQVTIKMAKDQNLAGNLSKISGPAEDCSAAQF